MEFLISFFLGQVVGCILWIRIFVCTEHAQIHFNLLDLQRIRFPWQCKQNTPYGIIEAAFFSPRFQLVHWECEAEFCFVIFEVKLKNSLKCNKKPFLELLHACDQSEQEPHSSWEEYSKIYIITFSAEVASTVISTINAPHPVRSGKLSSFEPSQ